MLAQGVKATYKDVKTQDGLYAFKLTVEGQDYDAYVTKSGKLFFPQVIDMNDKAATDSSAKKTTELPKTDKPDVKIFVMSYCPYGLQMQKAYLPVYSLLKNKATMGIYFVNYSMHGKKEIDENLRQYCIQKEQSDKYIAYLTCFTASTADADGVAGYASCLSKAAIDKTKLSACVAATDGEFKVTANFNDKTTWVGGTYPKFDVNADLNTQYKVEGSPTVIINGTDAAAAITSRSPEGLKEAICSTFNTQPEECSSALSAEVPGSGFGTTVATTANSTGGCGN